MDKNDWTQEIVEYIVKSIQIYTKILKKGLLNNIEVTFHSEKMELDIILTIDHERQEVQLDYLYQIAVDEDKAKVKELLCEEGLVPEFYFAMEELDDDVMAVIRDRLSQIYPDVTVCVLSETYPCDRENGGDDVSDKSNREKLEKLLNYWRKQL